MHPVCMKKALIIAVVLLVLLIVPPVALYYMVLGQVNSLPENDPSRCNALESGSRVLLVGDSITHGTVSFNYADSVASHLGDDYRVINAGINRNLTHNVLLRMPELIECRADVVTILIGTNDVNSTLHPVFLSNYRKTMGIEGTPDLQSYRENLTQIVDGFKQSDPHMQIALISLPVIGEDLNSVANQRAMEYSRAIKKIALEQGVAYLPLNEMQRSYLQGKETSNNQCNEPHLLIEKAVARRYLLGMDYSEISKKNDFYLVTDCLHLNERAGAMISELVVIGI